MRRILFSFFAALIVYFLSGCSYVNTNGAVSTYPNEDKYSVGDAELTGEINAVDIGWLAGSVKVKTHGADTILIEEKTNKPIDDDHTVHWYLDGKVLYIRYGASGPLEYVNITKDLTLTLPEGLILDSLELGSTSADITAENLSAKEIQAGSTSGTIDLEIRVGETVEAGSTSGKICIQSGDLKEISMGSTSGELTAETGSIEKLTAGSTSGSISVSASQVKEASFSSTSGSVKLAAEETPDKVKADTTSGSVTLILPEDAGFKASTSTGSGDVRCEIPCSYDNKKLEAGDGSGTFDLSTSSGNIIIKKK